MKIAIIGGNSQVGTELCFLLRAQGYEVFPVVRSALGAAFLRHHGFECRLADVSNPSEAQSVLNDASCVVLSFYTSDVGGPSKQSRQTSEKIIRNAVQFSQQASSLIYFSSIRAFSRRVDPSAPIWGAPYDLEKRHGENAFFQACSWNNKSGYVYRLGHVFGKHQSKTRSIEQMLHQPGVVGFAVNPSKPSNIVHTVTIAEAVSRTWVSNIAPGTYSVVNFPQWTWQEVLEYYAGCKHVKFVPEGLGNKRASWFPAKIARLLVSSTIVRSRNILAPVRTMILPTPIDQFLQYKAISQKVKNEIKQHYSTYVKPMYTSEFGYLPMPGPFVPHLTVTQNLLNSTDIPEGIF